MAPHYGALGVTSAGAKVEVGGALSVFYAIFYVIANGTRNRGLRYTSFAPASDCEFKMHFTDNFALTVYELVEVIDGADCNKRTKRKFINDNVWVYACVCVRK